MAEQVRRIAVTGGPGGGKTTVWRALRDAYPDLLLAVPEVATMMFENVFPQVQHPDERRAIQRAIYHVQHNLESFYERRVKPGQYLLCDRGTPDGGGYWPEGPDAFFASVGTNWDLELSRYEAVVFLQTAAAGGHSIAEGNMTRTESHSEAVRVDAQLHAVWSRHPRFCYVEQNEDFTVKISSGSDALRNWLRSG